VRTGPLDSSQSATFTFAAGTVVVVKVPAGRTVRETNIVITQAFDDPAARVSLGMSYAPHLFFDPLPAVAVTYQNSELTQIASAGDAIITVSPGTSTQGAGYATITFG